jgi:hypothetical protein
VVPGGQQPMTKMREPGMTAFDYGQPSMEVETSAYVPSLQPMAVLA